MNNEMLPADIFTRPRGPWQAHLHIKHLLTDEDIEPEQITMLGKEIAGKLRRCSLFTDEEIIENFEQVDDLEEFNSILDDMYDECDRVRIWVK
jgi:hypothetical protein